MMVFEQEGIVRFTPNSGHSEAHAGLPLVTHLGHLRVRSAYRDEPKTIVSRTAGHRAFPPQSPPIQITPPL